MAFEQGAGVGGTFIVPPAPGPAPDVSGVPSPPPAAPNAVNSPPAMPDWASMLTSSPYVIAATAMAQAQLAALQSQMGSNAARALINLGDVGLAKQVGGITLPGNTSGLVNEANTAGTSILSQLGHQHDLNQVAIPADLAGRGFYRSGETGYQLGNEARHYGQQQYTARQSTLDYLNGLYQNFLNAQFGIQQSELAAQEQAYQAALANIGLYVQPGSTGTPSPSAPPPNPYPGN